MIESYGGGLGCNNSKKHNAIFTFRQYLQIVLVLVDCLLFLSTEKLFQIAFECRPALRSIFLLKSLPMIS